MNQTLTQIQEEFDEKFTYQKPTRKYGKILYTTPVLLASVDEIKSFLTQSNKRVLEKVKEWADENVKKGKDGFAYNNVNGLGQYNQALDDLRSFLSTLIEQK